MERYKAHRAQMEAERQDRAERAEWAERAANAVAAIIAEQAARAAPTPASLAEDWFELWLSNELRDLLPNVVTQIICGYAPLLVAQAFVGSMPPTRAAASATTRGQSEATTTPVERLVPPRMTPWGTTAAAEHVWCVPDPTTGRVAMLSAESTRGQSEATTPPAARLVPPRMTPWGTTAAAEHVWCVPDPTTGHVAMFRAESTSNGLVVKRCVSHIPTTREADTNSHPDCREEWNGTSKYVRLATFAQGFDGVAAVRGASPQVPWLFILQDMDLGFWTSPSKAYCRGFVEGQWKGISALPSFPNQVGVGARLALAGRVTVQISLVSQAQARHSNRTRDRSTAEWLEHEAIPLRDLKHELAGIASHVVSMKSNSRHLFVMWSTRWHVQQHWPDQAHALHELMYDQSVSTRRQLRRQIHTLCIYDAMTLELLAERHIGLGVLCPTAAFIALTPHAVLTIHPPAEVAGTAVIRAFCLLPPFREFETTQKVLLASKAEEKDEPQEQQAEESVEQCTPNEHNQTPRESAKFRLGERETHNNLHTVRVMNVMTCGDTGQTVVLTNKFVTGTCAVAPQHGIEFIP